jgi:drug/metabolite transporter (DMT)-like permease
MLDTAKDIISTTSNIILNSTSSPGNPITKVLTASISGKKEKRNSSTMDFCGFKNVHKIIVGDIQILFASILFGFGFIGQRAVSVDGLGPLTCNAFRFTLSAIIIFIFLPLTERSSVYYSSSGSGGSTNKGSIANNNQKKGKISENVENMKNAFHLLCQKLYLQAKSCLNSLVRLNNMTGGSSSSSSSASNIATTPETVYTNDEAANPLLSSSGNASSSGANQTGSAAVDASSSQISASSIDTAETNSDKGEDDIINEIVYDIENPFVTPSTKERDRDHHSLDDPNSSMLLSDDDTDNTTNKYYRDLKNLKRNIIFWGVVLGLINFIGSAFQQFGIFYTSANKVAFISGFDLFFTPILTFLIPTLKHNGKPSVNIWIAVCLSIIGLYFLSDISISEGLSMGHGEFFAMISALFWSLHMIYTDMATAFIDSIYMVAIQSLIVGMLSLILALATESMPWLWYHFFLVIPWLLVLSVIEAAGLVFMIKGQKYSPPTHAAIITSLEGVFASIGSYIFLSETLTHREGFGCFLMLTAAFVTEFKLSSPTPISTKKILLDGKDSDTLSLLQTEKGNSLADDDHTHHS